MSFSAPLKEKARPQPWLHFCHPKQYHLAWKSKRHQQNLQKPQNLQIPLPVYANELHLTLCKVSKSAINWVKLSTQWCKYANGLNIGGWGSLAKWIISTLSFTKWHDNAITHFVLQSFWPQIVPFSFGRIGRAHCLILPQNCLIFKSTFFYSFWPISWHILS